MTSGCPIRRSRVPAQCAHHRLSPVRRRARAPCRLTGAPRQPHRTTGSRIKRQLPDAPPPGLRTWTRSPWQAAYLRLQIHGDNPLSHYDLGAIGRARPGHLAPHSHPFWRRCRTSEMMSDSGWRREDTHLGAASAQRRLAAHRIGGGWRCRSHSMTASAPQIGTKAPIVRM